MDYYQASSTQEATQLASDDYLVNYESSVNSSLDVNDFLVTPKPRRKSQFKLKFIHFISLRIKNGGGVIVASVITFAVTLSTCVTFFQLWW